MKKYTYYEVDLVSGEITPFQDANPDMAEDNIFSNYNSALKLSQNILSGVTAPLRKKLRIDTSVKIAKYLKEHGSLDMIIPSLDLRPDEGESVSIFLDWLTNNDDDEFLPSLSAKNLCILYKDRFYPELNESENE